jgi:hypothetical protein
MSTRYYDSDVLGATYRVENEIPSGYEEIVRNTERNFLKHFPILTKI